MCLCCMQVVVDEAALVQREVVPRNWAQRVRIAMARHPTLEQLEVRWGVTQRP